MQTIISLLFDLVVDFVSMEWFMYPFAAAFIFGVCVLLKSIVGGVPFGR